MIQKIIDYIDKNTSPYDSDFKIMFSLIAVAFLMFIKGDIFN